MKTLRILFCLTAFVFCTGLRLGQDRGGGDEIGLEFLAIAQSTLADLEKNQSFLFEQIKSQNLTQILENVHVMTVDAPLKVRVGTVIQDSVAVNDRRDQTILVNRLRWQSLTDPRAKAGIVLHEILSLAGLEETGFYPISSRYVGSLGALSDSIKPIQDKDQTYLTCLDTKSSLLSLSMSPSYQLRVDIRALSEENLTSLEALARAWGIKDFPGVVGLSFNIQAKALQASTLGRFDDYCRLDLYNRALFSCTDNVYGSHAISRVLTFKMVDGSSIDVAGESLSFWMNEDHDNLAFKFVAELPKSLEAPDATSSFTYRLNGESCR